MSSYLTFCFLCDILRVEMLLDYNYILYICYNKSDKKGDEMNVTFKWCGRRSECYCCKEPILVDTVVVHHTWRSKKGWKGGMFYHPDCFVQQFTYKVKMEVPKPVRMNRGRPSLGLSPEEMKDRRTQQRKERLENNSSRGT